MALIAHTRLQARRKSFSFNIELAYRTRQWERISCNKLRGCTVDRSGLALAGIRIAPPPFDFLNITTMSHSSQHVPGSCSFGRPQTTDNLLKHFIHHWAEIHVAVRNVALIFQQILQLQKFAPIKAHDHNIWDWAINSNTFNRITFVHKIPTLI
jgi:hypothetical protein